MARVIGAFVVGAVVAVSSLALITVTPQEGSSPAQSALRAFDDRIAEYVALHREVEASLTRLDPSTEPQLIFAHTKQLAAALKAARPKRRQGEFFTASVAPVFRDLIEEALYGHDVDMLLRDLFEEHPKTWGHSVRVHESYPSWATREVPGLLLRRLPALPEELEYRVVDHDLAIVDADANLVLDVLPAAIARASS